MSRHGYTDDGYDDVDSVLATGRWRGQVLSATRGKRGQQLLRDLLEALDAMEVKELYAGNFAVEGGYCTLGALGAHRQLDMTELQKIAADEAENDSSNSDVPYVAADAFNIAHQLAAEIMYANDECVSDQVKVTFEICGPVRPCYPEWGRHMVTEWFDDPVTPAKRWRHMRAWVAARLRGPQ